MVQQSKEKPYKRSPNRAVRPMIWQDGMAEVKETFRRVALVKHAGFSVWGDPRRGPTLEKILRWNRQAKNLSQVPKTLRDKIPVKILKEIQNNRSVNGYISQTHLQNVKGMCQRIHSQKSISERKKNLYDPTIYPVFVRRPPTVTCLVDSTELDTSPRNVHAHFRSRRRPHSSPIVDYRAPLSYTPQPFKLLYDISNGSYPVCSYAKRPRSGPAPAATSANSCYGRLFNRSASAMSKKSVLDIAEAVERQRVSSAPGGTRRAQRWLCGTQSPSSISSLNSTPKSMTRGWLEGVGLRRNSQLETGSNRSTEGESRPPSRCTNRPASSRSSWRLNLVEAPVLEDLSNRSTYSDCVPVDASGMPVLFSSGAGRTFNSPSEEGGRHRVSVPRLRLRGGHSSSTRSLASLRKAPTSLTSSALAIVQQVTEENTKNSHQELGGFVSCSDDETYQQEQLQRPSTANVPVNLSAESFSDWRPKSASNAMGRRGSRVTFASPVESSRWENKARIPEKGPDSSGEVEEELCSSVSSDNPEQVARTGNNDEEDATVVLDSKDNDEEQGEEAEGNEDVIIKHSADPYFDFKSSMMSMIESEGLEGNSQELEELFQYYMDLNPKMHHPILVRVVQDIRVELKLKAESD